MNIMKQWPVFFLLLAFAIAPLFQGIQTVVLVAIHILVLAVFTKGFLASYQKLRIPYNFLSFAICLFYLWMALSISWSQAPAASLYMFVWLTIFPLCFFIYSLKQPDDWAYLPVGILCITLIFALIGISQQFITKNVPTSFFLEKNTYAGMLNLIAQPTTAWFIISVKKRRKNLSIFLGAALFILFFAIFETGSRGAAISFAFGLTFIVFTCWRYVEKSSLLKVLIILIVAVLLADVRTDSMGYNMGDRLGQLNVRDNFFSARMPLWESGWQIIKTAPIIGTGIGTFFIVSRAVRQPNDLSSGNYLHNDYLQFWLETGFIGLSLLVFIMVAVSMLSIRLLRNKSLQRIDRLEITGLLAGLAAVALHTFVDFNFYIVAILMVMGFMCARIQEISGHYFSGLIRDFIPAHKVSKKIFMLVAAVFPFIILSYSLPIALGDYYWYKANEYFENSQIEKAELTLEKAASWNPGSIGIRFQQFSFYRNILQIIKSNTLLGDRKVLLANALMALSKIEDITPLAGIVHEGRGHLLIENTDIAAGDWEGKAINEFEKALQLQPRLYRSRVALARLLEQRGELNEAVLLMNDGIRYDYNDYLTGLDEFYEYAVKLNLMSGDTTKAREIQIELDEVKLYYKNLSPRE